MADITNTAHANRARSASENPVKRFFRATDANAVRDAFARIDEAQKIEFAASPPLVGRELFHVFALIGVVLLGLASFEAHFRAARVQGVT